MQLLYADGTASDWTRVPLDWQGPYPTLAACETAQEAFSWRLRPHLRGWYPPVTGTQETCEEVV